MPPYRKGTTAAKRRSHMKYAPQRTQASHICYEWLDEEMLPHSVILSNQDFFDRLYPGVGRRFTTPVNWDGEHFRLVSGEQLRLPYKAKV